MENRLQGRVALVTGGGRRVGAVVARALHAAGAAVMLHYHHSEAEARALADEFNRLRPDSAATHRCDLLDIDSLPGLVAATLARFGRLDVLLNNASSFYPTPLGGITEPDWLDLVGTNLKVPLFLSQAAAEALTAARGCIINMADIHVDRPVRHHIVYTIAKGGIVTLTRALARELGDAVRVNAIAPGYILWPENNPHFDDAARQRVVDQTPLKRIGAPEDVARTALFLILDAPFITGQILGVDGGFSAGFEGF